MNNFSFFSITFGIVFLFNQSKYNFCMTSYCLEHALPKVFIISLIITFIYTLIKEKPKEKPKENQIEKPIETNNVSLKKTYTKNNSIQNKYKKQRTANCFECKQFLKSQNNINCYQCGWMKCDCGSCGCNFKKESRYN